MVENGPVEVLSVTGEFTLDERPQIGPVLDDVVASDSRAVVLDLSGLTYVDSAGLMTVLSLYNKLDRAGKQMAVATGGNAYAEKKIREIGILRVPNFQAFETVDDAKQALAATS